jgi:adenylyltransferase/sulfurtransferase
VLGPIVNVVASLQAAEALKILAGRTDRINRDLIYVDVWENVLRQIKIAPLRDKVDCPCCKRHRFEWLEGAHGSQTTSLCGRNAVQVSQRAPARLNFEDMARHLGALGDVSYNRFLLKFTAEGYEFTVFPDGRAIIKGTSDEDKARTLYAKYVGH